MGYFRNVIVDRMQIQAMSVAIDETRAVMRILTPIPPEVTKENLIRLDSSILKTTRRIASPLVSLAEVRHFFEIEGKEWIVTAEAILDKTLEEYQRLWWPGVHFVFHYEPFCGLKIDPKGALSWFTMRNTAEVIRHDGGLWYFDLWVRNPADPLTKCSRSITTSKDLTLITNLENLGEQWSSDEVMKGGSSKWLNLKYRLTASSRNVNPNGVVEFTFEVLDGRTGERAADVSWDGYIVEAIDGYVPHKRMSVINGIGHFKAYALFLEKGETLRVKVGNRFNSSMAEHMCQVE